MATVTGSHPLPGNFPEQGPLDLNGVAINALARKSPNMIVQKINTETAQSGVTASLNSSGELVLNTSGSITIAGDAQTLVDMGLVAGTYT